MDFEVADSVVPCAGFRRWVCPPYRRDKYGELEQLHHDGNLVTRKHVWPSHDERGALPMEAQCQQIFSVHMPCPDGMSPMAECDCGIYGHHDLTEAKLYRAMEYGSGSIFGSMIGWGRIYFDDEWFRAQYALPIAFVWPWESESHHAEAWVQRTTDWLERVAAKYRVPILPLRELEEYTYRFGGIYRVEPLTKDEEERRK